jgi:hypothetical protein
MPGETARARPSDTMAKARKVLARHDTQCVTMTSTASVELIAREENVRASTVWNWISVARGGPTEVGEAQQSPEPRPPPKPMSERVVAGRAWLTWHLDERFLRLEPRAIIFWTQMVVAVHRLGDGFGLTFADAGFDDRADFAASCRGDEPLLAMLGRRRLIDDLGDAIALPRGLGLTPRERIGGKLIPAMRSGPALDRRQGSLGPMALPAPREPESGPESNRSPDRSQPESGANDSGFASFDSDRSPSGVGLAGGEGTKKTNTKREESLAFGVGLDTAGEAGERPDSGTTPAGTPVGDPSLTPVGTPARPPHVALAADVMAITGRPGHATPSDLNAVKTCLDSGGTPDGLREFATLRMGRDRYRKDPPTVSYLAKGYLDALAATPAAPIVKPDAPPAPEPPEDPAATVRLLHQDDDNPRLVAAWAPTRTELRAELGEGAWHLCRHMILGGLEGDEIVILLHTPFICDQVRERYGPRVETSLLRAYPEARRVDFRVTRGP